MTCAADQDIGELVWPKELQHNERLVELARELIDRQRRGAIEERPGGGSHWEAMLDAHVPLAETPGPVATYSGSIEVPAAQNRNVDRSSRGVFGRRVTRRDVTDPDATQSPQCRCAGMTEEGVRTAREERGGLAPKRDFDRRTGLVDAPVLTDQSPRRNEVLGRAVRNAPGPQLVTTNTTSLKLSDLLNPLIPGA
ncbi:MAG: hypothetical protein ACTHQQ_14535 [Solirubrobacteraceae bacterium]